jgi:hypothetical protein
MLERVSLMIRTTHEARESIKMENISEACAKVEDLFKVYPDHLTDVGQHMNLAKKKINKFKNTIFAQLIDLHQESNTCRSGKAFENVDPKVLSKNLKKLELSLKRQHSLIKKNDTDFENSFYYQYEF